MTEQIENKTLIEQLRQTLPPIWDRKNTGELTGGAVHPRTLTNQMSRGEGPGGTYRIGGKKVIIEREAFLEWLATRIKRNEGTC